MTTITTTTETVTSEPPVTAATTANKPNIRWRRKAKDLLFNYPAMLEELKRSEQDALHSAPTQQLRPLQAGNVPDPTAVRAGKLLSERRLQMQKDVLAVQSLLKSYATGRRVDEKKLRLIYLVYLTRTESLLHAAERLGISERTAKRWNAQALEYIAYRKKWL